MALAIQAVCASIGSPGDFEYKAGRWNIDTNSGGISTKLDHYGVMHSSSSLTTDYYSWGREGRKLCPLRVIPRFCVTFSALCSNEFPIRTQPTATTRSP